MAVRHGYEPTVRLLLDHGANIKGQNQQGDTPLLLAACYRHESTVRLLLDHGAKIKGQKRNGDTALLLATRSRHESTVRLLLEQEPMFDAKDGFWTHSQNSESSVWNL